MNTVKVLNPLKSLQQFGQSIWFDYVRRNLLVSGELTRLIKEDGLRGMTSNPAIFEKAIAGSTDYDEALRKLGSRHFSGHSGPAAGTQSCALKWSHCWPATARALRFNPSLPRT